MIIIESFLLIASVVSLIAYFILYKYTSKKIILFFGLLLIFCILIMRVVLTKHAPFSNLYESLIFFSFVYLIKLLITKYFDNKKSSLLALPSLILIIIALFLSGKFKIYQDLSPVLKSVWIYIHVPGFFIGYLSLTFAFVISIINYFKNDLYGIYIENEIKLSYFFITLGIITGSFWAEQSWASFWSWDPKEVWALITWLFIALSFHVKNYRLKFFIIFFAFLSMLFNYFGVMFLIKGLHSYL